MASEKITAIVESVKTMTVLELKELVGANVSQDDVKLGLLLLSGSSSAGGSGSGSSNSRNAELLADGVNELFQLQNSHSLDRLDNGSDLLRS